MKKVLCSYEEQLLGLKLLGIYEENMQDYYLNVFESTNDLFKYAELLGINKKDFEDNLKYENHKETKTFNLLKNKK